MRNAQNELKVEYQKHLVEIQSEVKRTMEVLNERNQTRIRTEAEFEIVNDRYQDCYNDRYQNC